MYIRFILLLIIPINKAPKKIPGTAPVPPLKDTPPIAHAAIAYVSKVFPPVGCAEAFLAVKIMPASAAQIPLII